MVGWTASQPYVLMAMEIAMATANDCWLSDEATAVAMAVAAAICALPPWLLAEAMAEAEAKGSEVAKAEA